VTRSWPTASPSDTPATPADGPRATRRRLARSSIGVVPITWNNVDLTDLGPEVPWQTVLDACAALGFEGVQLGRGFPEGDALRRALGERGLRLAEIYAELPTTADGPSNDALEIGRGRLALLDGAGGETLVAACRVGGGREAWAGRGDDPGAPRLTDQGWHRLAEVLERLGAEAAERGHALAFHPHAGTFIETPDEVARLASVADADVVGFCLDVGHYTVGGGDPVAAVADLRGRVRHVHVKDVDGAVLGRLRSGAIGDFGGAIRARLFTEVGRGIVDVDGLVAALDEAGYAGWLMVEQDSTWLAPEDALRIGRSALLEALGR
jgi:inosose dehydratase